MLSKKYGNSLVYIIDAEEMRLVYLGDVVQKLSEAQLEEINGVDILFVSGQAASFVYQIDPKILIPTADKSQDIFLKTLGVAKPD
ncbi:MAG: MBL fold metallo-hydrolase, partial [Candidatus Pacearchaeota archaeon]